MYSGFQVTCLGGMWPPWQPAGCANVCVCVFVCVCICVGGWVGGQVWQGTEQAHGPATRRKRTDVCL